MLHALWGLGSTKVSFVSSFKNPWKWLNCLLSTTGWLCLQIYLLFSRFLWQFQWLWNQKKGVFPSSNSFENIISAIMFEKFSSYFIEIEISRCLNLEKIQKDLLRKKKKQGNLIFLINHFTKTIGFVTFQRKKTFYLFTFFVLFQKLWQCWFSLVNFVLRAWIELNLQIYMYAVLY